MSSVWRWLWRIYIAHSVFVFCTGFGFVYHPAYLKSTRHPLMPLRGSVFAHKAAYKLRAKLSLEDLLGEEGRGVLMQHLDVKDEVPDENQLAKLQKRQAKREKLKAKKMIQEMLTSTPRPSSHDRELDLEQGADDLQQQEKSAEGQSLTSERAADDRPVTETKEERLRRERPARVQFANSSPQPNFVSLKLDHIAIAFGDQVVLQDASWDVKTGDRVGLVGGNGNHNPLIILHRQCGLVARNPCLHSHLCASCV